MRIPAAIGVILITLPILCSLAQGDDVYPPNINMTTRFPVVTFEGKMVTIEARIVDSSGVQSATIAYEIEGTRYVDQMVEAAGQMYQWTYVDYDIGSRTQLIVKILNITAVDHNSNWGAQVYMNTTITVLKEDTEGPTILMEAMPLYTESEDHLIIRGSVTDPSGVNVVKLHYEKDGQWTEKSMVYNDQTKLYEAIVGPFDVDAAVRYYVNATDASGKHNKASTLETDNGDMRSFVASFRMRFEGGVEDSNYMQVPELYRYKVTGSWSTTYYGGYRFLLRVLPSGLLTGNVSVGRNGAWLLLQDVSLAEKNNVVVTDRVTTDGMVYDFNLIYYSYSSSGPYAEVVVNPRQKLIFEGYTLTTYIKKVSSGQYTFKGKDGGNWQVSVNATLGYQTISKTFTSRNQFLQFYIGGKKDVQIIYLGEELIPGDLLRYRARFRVYKFQPPIFNVTSDVPTGSPEGLAEGQIIYNVYAGDMLAQKVMAHNSAGSRAYDIEIKVTNITGHGLVVYEGELTSSQGPVYREKQVGDKIVRYYLTYGTLTRSFNLTFPTSVQIRESATFDVLLSYDDAHGDSHEVSIPVQFLIYPSTSTLKVTKRLSRDSLFIGSQAIAYIDIENTGGSPAVDVTVIDNTPPNLISDYEVWHGEVRPGASNKVSLSYSLKPTTITTPGLTPYGFVTVDWKGVCYKEGVRNDAYTLSTQDFYFNALGPHLIFTQFSADRPIVEQGGQQMIFINLGEKVVVTAILKNDGNRIAENLSLTFPGFLIQSTDFPMGTPMEVGQYVSFTATVSAVTEGSIPFQARITHQDEFPSLGNVYHALSNFITAQTYRSPVMVQFLEAPTRISAGEIGTISLSIRNVGNSPVENARVLLDLTPGLEMVYGTYLVWEGRLGPMESILAPAIQIKGKDFGPNKVTATASGRDIPSVDYELAIEVLSPHIEIVRTINCEYLLARQEYWPRAWEISSKVILTLKNTGNDQAVKIVVTETLPNGLLSFDNLTFGSNLIVWGEAGDITLAPGESEVLEYPVWSQTPGHYTFPAARATYTNPTFNLYESRSAAMELWVLIQRPFLVPERGVLVLDKEGNAVTAPVTYNDTVTFSIAIRNIGNQLAHGLELQDWLEQGVPGFQCIVLNRDEISDALAQGIAADSVLTVPIEVVVLEDTPATKLYNLQFPFTYLDEENRNYPEVLSSYVMVRPARISVYFSKSFVRRYVSPGERPQLEFRVSNEGDTDLSKLRAVIELPGGISIASSPTIDVLREGETKTLVVEFDPIHLTGEQVYETFRGFGALVEYETFRGKYSTPEDGEHLELSVARPFIEVARSVTSTVLLARSDQWPFSSRILENVTIRLTNTAEVQARGVKVVETLPEGLYTLPALGTSQIVWGADGSLTLEKGESRSFTYPVWSYSEGSARFEQAVVSYRDSENHQFESYSKGVEEVVTVSSRPYVTWEGEILQDPAGSLCYNDTVTFRLTIMNIGNSKSSGMELLGWTTDGPSHEDWQVLNPEDLGESLSTDLLAGSTKELLVVLRVLKDAIVADSAELEFSLVYSDHLSRTYSTNTTTEVFLRPAIISVLPKVFDSQYVLMPKEVGFYNLTLSNMGDADVTNVAIQVQCPNGLSVASSGSLDLLREGQSANISISFAGVDLGESIGKVYQGINLTISYTDFRGKTHSSSLGGFNLTLKRPMLALREISAKTKTRLGSKYRLSIVLANEGTYPASGVRISLGDLSRWLGGIQVQGGTLEGSEIILGENVAALDEVEVTVTGRVLQKGRFTLTPEAVYADRIGGTYQLTVDPVRVKSAEKLLKMLLPFLLWAGAAAGIGVVYYYETRVAEKIKGHQLGSLANSVLTHVDATRTVPPLIPFRKKKLSLAEFSYLLSLYLSRASSTSMKRADRTTFRITHPQSRLVPGQEFKSLTVVKDAYMLLAEMIQNRVKSAQVVPPTFLVQGFKFGLSDVTYLLSLAVSRLRTDGRLPRSVVLPCSTGISAGKPAGGEAAEGGREAGKKPAEVVAPEKDASAKGSKGKVEVATASEEDEFSKGSKRKPVVETAPPESKQDRGKQDRGRK